MKIAFITAGAGKSYCGSCLHDILLIQSLIDSGHNVKVIDMYTPLSVDFDAPPLPVKKIHYSGINTYLRQKFAFFRRRPLALNRFFERPSVVNFALGFGMDVSPVQLGEMTLSVLRGKNGNQALDLAGVMGELKKSAPYDVCVLSNSMLSALAPEIKKELNTPVVCQLMGEEAFITMLGEPYWSSSIEALRKNVISVDAFISHSGEYSKIMSDFLGRKAEDIIAVNPSVNAALYDGIKRREKPFTVGFLSKLNKAKGFDGLLSAFIILVKEHKADAYLLAGGEILDGESKAYFEEVMKKAASAGVAGRFKYLGRLEFAAKKGFFAGSSVFSVPSLFPESKGIAALEALAAGLPVALPDHGAYRDIVKNTGGGLLYKPGSASGLAALLKKFYDEPALAGKLGEAGREGVKNRYSVKKMTEMNVEVYRKVQ